LNADPVSWLLIEPGWEVVDAAGAEIGKVVEVEGDEQLDIFDGLIAAAGLRGKRVYVPAEQIAEIVEGAIRLAVPRGELEG
jgi:Uncharacterized protein conserved in bacteria (DUF2171)